MNIYIELGTANIYKNFITLYHIVLKIFTKKARYIRNELIYCDKTLNYSSVAPGSSLDGAGVVGNSG